MRAMRRGQDSPKKSDEVGAGKGSYRRVLEVGIAADQLELAGVGESVEGCRNCRARGAAERIAVAGWGPPRKTMKGPATWVHKTRCPTWSLRWN